MAQVAEQFEDQLEIYEKDAVKLTGKTAMKAGGKIFAFVIAKPTAKGLAALKNAINEKTEKSLVSLKDLQANGETVKDLEITDENIKAFEPVAKKYGIKYSLHEITPSPEALKENPKTPLKYMVFFKAKDESVMKAALTEFSAMQQDKRKKKQLQEQKTKTDVKKKIAKNKEIIDSRPKNTINKNKNKER